MSIFDDILRLMKIIKTYILNKIKKQKINKQTKFPPIFAITF